MITYFNIIGQEWSDAYLAKNQRKPYKKLLILPSGIKATYGALDWYKDKLDIAYIDIAEDNLRYRPVPFMIMMLASKRYDLEGSVTFKFVTKDGLAILIKTADQMQMQQLIKLAEQYNKTESYAEWLKKQH